MRGETRYLLVHQTVNTSVHAPRLDSRCLTKGTNRSAGFLCSTLSLPCGRLAANTHPDKHISSPRGIGAPYVFRSCRPHCNHAKEAHQASHVLGIFYERRCCILAFCGSRPRGPQDAGSSTAALRAGSSNASHTRECRTTVHTFLHRSWGKLPMETCVTPLSI